MLKDIIKKLKEYKYRKYTNAYNIPWEILQHLKINKNQTRKISVAILNTPCHGFGDLIFVHKLANYLIEWYNCTVDVYTTLHKKLNALDNKSKYSIHSLSNSKHAQCRKLKYLKTINKKYDLYFVAPVPTEFKPKILDVKSICKSANLFNTYFFSEYNHPEYTTFDFPTGVSKRRCGLLLTDPIISNKPVLSGKYALCYISDNVSLALKCFLSFLELIVDKYKRIDTLQIVVPKWIVDEMLSKPYKMKEINKKYQTIEVIGDKKFVHENKISNNKTLIVRGDIFPVDNSTMLNLMKYSLKDILLTGDQSITDALACCADKNIFYQIAEWKESLGKQLGKMLPNEYLLSKKTSCGTIKAIKYNSDYRQFIDKYDFRKISKNKLNGIFNLAVLLKENKDPVIKQYIHNTKQSRKIKTLLNKMEKMD
jgi:hypothetical protein